MKGTLYTLERDHGLERGLTIKRLKLLEGKEFIEREEQRTKKVIVLTEKAFKVVRYIEAIKS